MIEEHSLDIAAITETWVSSDAPDVIKFAAVPEGYAVLHEHRPGSGRRGGGLALIYKNSFNVKVIKTKDVVHSTFELMLAPVSGTSDSVLIGVVYRPPSSSLSTFYTEPSDFLEADGELANRFVLMGDLSGQQSGQ